MTARLLIFGDINAERVEQDRKWGGPAHDDEHTHAEWIDYIHEHAAKARASPSMYRNQLVRVAALAVAAIEAHDRKV